MIYELEKEIWTEQDFEIMGWHDSTIYKIRVSEDLELDIDYIFQWNEPELDGLPFTFWVAPCTLVFKQITGLKFEIKTSLIESIKRQITTPATLWTIFTRQGDFEFYSGSYEQFIRQAPSFQFGQTISFLERNGLSLERITNQENPYILEDEFIENSKKDWRHFETVKKRHLIRQEIVQLEKARENNEIGTKEYLLKKIELEKILDFYNTSLKGTQFEKL